MHVASAIGNSLYEAFSMFWETLWALVLGFGLSGAVQAFVSRSRMRATLGDHRPATVGKAGLLGMVSSSCSYAAAALAKSLFARGADFTASMVFMFASTNLVVELGIVLWLLLARQPWQSLGSVARSSGPGNLELAGTGSSDYRRRRRVSSHHAR